MTPLVHGWPPHSHKSLEFSGATECLLTHLRIAITEMPHGLRSERVYGITFYLSSSPSEHSLWSQTVMNWDPEAPAFRNLSPEANILWIAVSPSVVVVVQ